MPSNTQRHHSPGRHNLQLWSPVDVLSLCEDGRCIGYAYSKRRECHNPINYMNRTNFSSKLDYISKKTPNPERLRDDLMELAGYGLCIRNHQDQAEALVEKWIKKIRTAYPRTVRSEPRRASAQEYIERVSNSRQASVRPPPVTRTSTSDISSLALSRRSTATTGSSSVNSVSSSSSSSSRSSTPSSSVAPRTPSSSDTTQSPRRVATTNSRPSTPATSAAPSSSSSSEPPSPTSTSPSRTTTPCTTPHARRLPLSTQCPVCQSGPELSALPPSSLTWCKSSCGQSLHKSCFSRWAQQRTSDGRSPTCVMCRADWVDECECQGCLHVPRREVEGECGICYEELEGEEGGLVWCKEGCGKSVHRVCFRVWEEHCAEGGGGTTCVLCRASWGEGECGC